MTFDSHDKLERKAFAESLERYLFVEQDYVEGSLVISINALRLACGVLMAHKASGQIFDLTVSCNSFMCGSKLGEAPLFVIDVPPH